MSSYSSMTLDASQLDRIVTSNTTRDITNVGNKTSDRGKSLYQIPHPYNYMQIAKFM